MNKPDKRSALTKAEAAKLADCEKVIGRGLKKFVEVGKALAEVRDGGLSRATHATFGEYCQDRWGFNDRHGRRYIAAAQAAQAAQEIGPMGPRSERAARELVPLLSDPPLLNKVLEQVQLLSPWVALPPQQSSAQPVRPSRNVRPVGWHRVGSPLRARSPLSATQQRPFRTSSRRSGLSGRSCRSPRPPSLPSEGICATPPVRRGSRRKERTRCSTREPSTAHPPANAPS